MARICLCDEQRRKAKTKDLCRWIRAIAGQRDKSLTGFAEAMGISKQSLNYHLESGRAFTGEQMIALFEYGNADDKTILKFMRIKE